MNRYDQMDRPETDVRMSLRGTLDQAEKYIDNAHELVDDLEDRLLCPRPRTAQTSAGGGKIDTPAPHPGVRTVAQTLDSEASRLCARLNELLQEV